jgi:hypothetical protein
MQEINCEILQDIISDHKLCYMQKEELMKVINLFSSISTEVYIIPKAISENDKPIRVIFED